MQEELQRGEYRNHKIIDYKWRELLDKALNNKVRLRRPLVTFDHETRERTLKDNSATHYELYRDAVEKNEKIRKNDSTTHVTK